MDKSNTKYLDYATLYASKEIIDVSEKVSELRKVAMEELSISVDKDAEIMVGNKGVDAYCDYLDELKGMAEKDGIVILCAAQNTGKSMRGDTVQRTIFDGMFEPQLVGDDDGNTGTLELTKRQKFMSVRNNRGKRAKRGWKDILCK